MNERKPQPAEKEERSELDIAELALERPSQIDGNVFPLLAELRFGATDVVAENGEFSFRFGIREAFLKLQLNGCKIKMGSRRGEADHPDSRRQEVTFRKKHEQAQEGILHGGVEISAKKLDAGFGAGGKVRATAMQQEERHGKRIEEQRVFTALPNGRWRFNVLDENYLEGRLLDANPPLCEIETESSRFVVQASVGFEATSDNIVLLKLKRPVKRARGALREWLTKRGAKEGIKGPKELALAIIIAKALRQEGDYVEVVRHRIDHKKGA